MPRKNSDVLLTKIETCRDDERSKLEVRLMPLFSRKVR